MDGSHIIQRLKELENKDQVAYRQAKFGIIATNSLGIPHKELNIIAKEVGKDSYLALELYNSGIYEGKLLCSKLFKPRDLTKSLMESWAKAFENWEICDSFSMGIFSKSLFALEIISDCTAREAEFEKRVGFATMASYCMADKKASNKVYESFLPFIKSESQDSRLYVRKAVNWALRSIGKRNADLNREAIITARELMQSPDNTARWIGSNALKELEKADLRLANYPRENYGP